MTGFFQGAAAVLLAAILVPTLGKQGKEMGLLLTMAVCAMVCVVAMAYLEPVVELVERLQEETGLDGEMLRILLKSVGIGLTGEIASLICADSGNAALGKALQMLSGAVILWLAIPLINGLLELVEKILGEV